MRSRGSYIKLVAMVYIHMEGGTIVADMYIGI